MIKNGWSAAGSQISAVKDDIRHNKEFGSLFQFWLNEMTNEMCRYFETGYEQPSVNTNIDYDTIHTLCVRLLNVIAQ